MLPAVYQQAEPFDGDPRRLGAVPDEPFVQRLCAALDEVLAPVLCTLDNLHAYVDPALAPPDFLTMLEGWVGAPDAVEVHDLERRRTVVRTITALHGARGTLGALRQVLELLSGVDVDVRDNGAVTWSKEPGPPPPGTRRPYLVVRVTDDGDVDVDLLRAVIEAWKPAHVPYELEVLTA